MSQTHKSEYEEVRNLSFENLVMRGLITQNLIVEFKELETQMGRGGLLGENFLVSYQKSDDIYKRHLTKILEALKNLGEPHAAEKLKVVIEELATMGPAAFLTPWELTLSYLDREYGDFNDVVDFYRK